MTGYKGKVTMSAGEIYTPYIPAIHPKTPLELGQGRVSGSRYYTVKPIINWWDRGYSTSNPWRDMATWCTDTYGPTPKDGIWTPNARWYCNNSKFWFRNEEDQTMFILRWS